MTGFAVIGCDHNHIYAQVRQLIDAGGVLRGYATGTDARAALFEDRFPLAKRLSEAAILADPEVRLVTSAAIPFDRAGIATRAMTAGKDVLLDKPGAVNRAGLAAMRAVYAATGRRVMVHYSELENSAAALTALRLVREGAIGKLVHFNATAPHRLDQGLPRPDWFWNAKRAGGILSDILSHQIAQFVVFTPENNARVVAAQVLRGTNGFQISGDVFLESGTVQGVGHVDWLTPKGMPVWGDGRLMLTGTDGVIEVRKLVDVAGEGVGGHVILTDAQGPRRVVCDAVSDFCARCLRDATEGTSMAMDQDLAFHIMSLALDAQEMADAPRA